MPILQALSTLDPHIISFSLPYSKNCLLTFMYKKHFNLSIKFKRKKKGKKIWITNGLFHQVCKFRVKKEKKNKEYSQKKIGYIKCFFPFQANRRMKRAPEAAADT